MADLKRRTLLLTSGKQVRLYGNSIAIGKNLEIGEGNAPTILSFKESGEKDNSPAIISNPHKLTAEDFMEMADYNIQLWMNLKANIRKYGFDNPKIFSADPGL
jgi:hypothetical protein